MASGNQSTMHTLLQPRARLFCWNLKPKKRAMSISVIIISAFSFRLLRECEDLIARGKWRNRPLLPRRKGEQDEYTAKWAYPLRAYAPKWYHFGIAPRYEERFAFSSTLLVWVTDTEHLLQFGQTVAIGVIAWQLGGLLPVLVGLAIGQIIKELLKYD